MLFLVSALFLFVLTTVVAAVPSGSRPGNSEATEVGTTPLENKAAYLSGGLWTRQSNPLEGQCATILSFTNDNNHFAVLIRNSLVAEIANGALNELTHNQERELVGTWGRMDDKMKIYYDINNELCIERIIGLARTSSQPLSSSTRGKSRKFNTGQ